MVQRVVDLVTSEAQHREDRAIRASSGPIELVGRERFEAICEVVGSGGEFVVDVCRILQIVTVGFSSLVWIPVGELGIVLGEHELESGLKQSEDISNVCRVLEWAPHMFAGPSRHVVAACEDLVPACGVRSVEDSDLSDAQCAHIGSTLRTRTLEDPCPVFVVLLSWWRWGAHGAAPAVVGRFNESPADSMTTVWAVLMLVVGVFCLVFGNLLVDRLHVERLDLADQVLKGCFGKCPRL